MIVVGLVGRVGVAERVIAMIGLGVPIGEYCSGMIQIPKTVPDAVV